MKVICINLDGHSYITLDKKYMVEYVTERGDYMILNDINRNYEYPEYMFIEEKVWRSKQLKTLLEAM